MTETATERLYGMPHADRMWFDPATVYESEIEPYVDEHDRRPIEIEEWSVHPAIYHVPSTDTIIEWLVERVGEDGEVTEEGYDAWERGAKSDAVIAAAEQLRTALAATITFRMANKHLRSLTVSWDDQGEPLLDGQPMYVKSGMSR